MSEIDVTTKSTVKSVKDNVLQQTKKANQESGSKNELGKDAFLQLLVTQMKYQDPLNPNTDTEYIAQLATFSQLEQMQNISTVTTNSQAFGLVGKDVIVKNASATGSITYISGRVDFVNMSNGKAQMSINGKLYPIQQLDSVIDGTYMLEQGLPGIKEKLELKHDANNTKDLTFTVNMGEGETVADDVAIQIGKAVVDTSLVDVSGNKVTIKKEAFKDLLNGTYKVTVGFNDALLTVVKDMVTLTVQNSKVAVQTTDNNTNPVQPADNKTEDKQSQVNQTEPNQSENNQTNQTDDQAV